MANKAKKKKLSDKHQIWVDARKRHRLSHAQVQMARELGMNPKRLGKKDNHKQEPWKMPLPEFIEHLYFKRFGRERPEVVMSITDRAKREEKKKAARREARRKKREQATGDDDSNPLDDSDIEEIPF